MRVVYKAVSMLRAELIKASEYVQKRAQTDPEKKAARDLKLEGDLQHSGVHFRASHEVTRRVRETSYLWSPDLPGPGGKVSGHDLKWCRLLFPIGDHWYTGLQLSAPSNPVDELSWRDYGRFGFFFKKTLPKAQVRELDYRFIIERADAPALKPKQSPEQIARSRAACDAHYEAFAKSPGR